MLKLTLTEYQSAALQSGESRVLVTYCGPIEKPAGAAVLLAVNFGDPLRDFDSVMFPVALKDSITLVVAGWPVKVQVIDAGPKRRRCKLAFDAPRDGVTIIRPEAPRSLAG